MENIEFVSYFFQIFRLIKFAFDKKFKFMKIRKKKKEEEEKKKEDYKDGLKNLNLLV